MKFIYKCERSGHNYHRASYKIRMELEKLDEDIESKINDEWTCYNGSKVYWCFINPGDYKNIVKFLHDKTNGIGSIEILGIKNI